MKNRILQIFFPLIFLGCSTFKSNRIPKILRPGKYFYQLTIYKNNKRVIDGMTIQQYSKKKFQAVILSPIGTTLVSFDKKRKRRGKLFVDKNFKQQRAQIRLLLNFLRQMYSFNLEGCNNRFCLKKYLGINYRFSFTLENVTKVELNYGTRFRLVLALKKVE